ncbi:hypothetical protein D3C81_2039810 [compost metagenome]
MLRAGFFLDHDFDLLCIKGNILIIFTCLSFTGIHPGKVRHSLQNQAIKTLHFHHVGKIINARPIDLANFITGQGHKFIG